jgi:raffinose/stachyose/melibiose transport system substrate-binding protein
MSLERILNVVGFSLLALCFVLSMGRIVKRKAKDLDPDVRYLRIAHNVQEDGMQRGLQAAARAFTEMYPDVVVEQIVVPARVYRSWTNTMLIGEQAPDLMLNETVFGEQMIKYFESYNRLMDQPNPYNEGTDLEGVPWRNTFIDSLEGRPAFLPMNYSYYGVPLTASTTRMLYNRNLLERITGSSEPPDNYEDFIDLCKAIHAYAKEEGRWLIPVAGSGTSDFLVRHLIMSQTQRLALELDQTRRLTYISDQVGVAYLQDRWRYDMQQVRLGLELVNEIVTNFQPGFMQATTQDALFYFAQERAVMMIATAIEAQSILSQLAFEAGVFEIPLPDTQHPKYGKYLLGRTSEAGNLTRFVLGLTRQSKHPDLALEFVYFLTSLEGNRIFAETSGRLPSVVGVTTPRDMQPFIPRTEGYPPGLFPVHLGPGMELFDSQFYILQQGAGGTEAFIDAMDANMTEAVVEGFNWVVSVRTQNVQSQDTWVGSLWYELENRPPANEKQNIYLNELLDGVTELQLYQDAGRYWIKDQVAKAGYELRVR